VIGNRLQLKPGREDGLAILILVFQYIEYIAVIVVNLCQMIGQLDNVLFYATATLGETELAVNSYLHTSFY
jgi:hypothetical protein